MKKENEPGILPLIDERWSPRAFTGQPVLPEQVQRLLLAAGKAPSAFNDQPWAFITGFRGDETWQAVFDCLADGNKAWAGNVPVLMLSVGRRVWARDGVQENPTWKYDLGQSVAFLTMQATYEGLWVHQMGGFEKEKARAGFEIPDTWEPVTVIAVGYKAGKEILPDNLAAMETGPKKRKEFSTFVFAGKFGRVAPWLIQ